jgi:hypothetical protein
MANTTSEPDIKQLSDNFWDAYKVMREAWLKTGGGMDMELKVRDAAAETAYQHRSAAAKKGGAKRRARHG